MVRKSKKITGFFKKYSILIFFIMLFSIGIFFFGTQQSVLSVSDVKLENGKVFWVVQGSANSYSPEIYTFNPSTYTYKDGSGTEVRPQDDLVLAVSKVNSQCQYLTTQKYYYNAFFQKKYYYILNNPQKIANVNFTDGHGTSKILDGTIVQETSISDTDGKGEIIIQTQGLLSGKYNCPSYENVIYFEDDKRFFDRLKWENERKKVLNSQFTNTFDSVGINNNIVNGGINIGNVVFTITADQDYFDSVVYTPPKQSDPNIIKINAPDEIQAGQTSSIIVEVKNRVADSGNIIIKPTSNYFTFSPSVINKNLPGSEKINVNFNIQASGELGNKKGNVEVCSSSQFTSDVNCDNMNFYIKITEDEPIETCGNDICEFNEDKQTCPEDCTEIIPDEECPPITIIPSVGGSEPVKIPDFICLIKVFFKNVGEFLQQIKSIFSVIGLFVGTFFTRRLLKNIKTIKDKKWLIWSLSILAGIISLFLIFTYFWFGIIILIILGIVRWIVPGI